MKYKGLLLNLLLGLLLGYFLISVVGMSPQWGLLYIVVLAVLKEVFWTYILLREMPKESAIAAVMIGGGAFYFWSLYVQHGY